MERNLDVKFHIQILPSTSPAPSRRLPRAQQPTILDRQADACLLRSLRKIGPTEEWKVALVPLKLSQRGKISVCSDYL